MLCLFITFFYQCATVWKYNLPNVSKQLLLVDWVLSFVCNFSLRYGDLIQLNRRFNWEYGIR